MGTRKLNPFMKFMGTFRKQNKGKYDFKQMGREAGKAWRKVKGGGRMPGSGPKCMEDSDSSACKAEFDKDAAENQGMYGGRRHRTRKRRR